MSSNDSQNIPKLVSRREFIRQSSLATLGGAVALSSGCQLFRASGTIAKSKRPNVVVIVSDDQGYGDIGIFGNEDIQTPHLDRLAGEGLALTQHYAGAPLCAPSRAALLTGRYNHRVGALSVESNRGLDRINLRETTIAEMFTAAGYRTGMIGKWHNGVFDKAHHPNNRGFQEFAGFLNGGMKYYEWILDYNGRPKFSDGRYLTDVFTDEAISFIDRYRTEPFFLYVAYNAPHSPLQVPEEDVNPFNELGKFNVGVASLYGMLRAMDRGIGRILDKLDETDLAENTFVLFTSDNGPWMGNYRMPDEHGNDTAGFGGANVNAAGLGPKVNMQRYNGPFRGMKQDVLEGGIRVPAIIRWPAGISGGVQFHDMVHFCDWMPTLLATAGITAFPDLPLDGINVLPVLQGRSGQVMTKRFWQFNRYEPVLGCNGAMRDGDWKLYWPRIPEAMVKLKVDGTWYRRMMDEPHFLMEVDMSPIQRPEEPSEPREPELYNIKEDPYENKNLAAQHPERIAMMQLEMENWFHEVNAERCSLPDNWKG